MKYGFVNKELRKIIDKKYNQGFPEDEIIEALPELETWLYAFIRQGIWEKQQGRQASWEKIVGGLND